jgi:hypothetical protein
MKREFILFSNAENAEKIIFSVKTSSRLRREIA